MAYQLQGGIFDGTNDVGHLAANIGAPNGTSAFVQAWVRKLANGVRMGVVYSQGNRFHLEWVDSSNRLRLRIHNSSGSNAVDINISPAVTDQDWHHFAVSFDPSSMAVRWDGVAQALGSYNGDNLIWGNPSNWYVGAQSTSLNRALAGSIADLSIHLNSGFVDLDDPAVLGLIWSPGGYAPDAGLDGTAGGALPAAQIRLSRRGLDTPDELVTKNHGTAGDFVMVGALDEDDVDARPPASEAYAGPSVGQVDDFLQSSNVNSWSTGTITPDAGPNTKLVVSAGYHQTSQRELARVTYAGHDLTKVRRLTRNQSGAWPTGEVWELDNPAALAASGQVYFELLSGTAYQWAVAVATLSNVRAGLPEAAEIVDMLGTGGRIAGTLTTGEDHSLAYWPGIYRGWNDNYVVDMPGMVQHRYVTSGNNTQQLLASKQEVAAGPWVSAMDQGGSSSFQFPFIGYRAPGAQPIGFNPALARVGRRVVQ